MYSAVAHSMDRSGRVLCGLTMVHYLLMAIVQPTSKEKPERPASVTKQMALRKPQFHESYPQFSPYIGRKRHIGHMSINLFWQPVASQWQQVQENTAMNWDASSCSHKTDL